MSVLVCVALSVGVTARGIAWPIVLVLCGALMILPFVFLVLVFRADDPQPTAAPAEVPAAAPTATPTAAPAQMSADDRSEVSTPAAARGR